jgi:hypothetical protein
MKLPRFEVLSGSTVIGHSELEGGDPPMGVALGRFLPLPAYASVQPAVLAAPEGSQAHLALSVRMAGGPVLPSVGGVQLLDYSADLGLEGMEVYVLGIAYPLYDQLFPSHVAAYHAKFQSDKSEEQE